MIGSINNQLGACSFVHRRILGAVTGFIGGGPAGAGRGFFGGGGNGGDTRVAPPVSTSPFGPYDPGANLGPVSSCQSGYERNPTTGVCERTGIVGAAQRFLPGGQTGTQADIYGEAVMGGFGLPALVPAQVGTIERTDGTVGPILRCPPRMVLGVDDLCYTKGTRGLAAFRKWRPGTPPFLTGGDVKCLRRANTLRDSKGSKKLLKELGVGG